MKLLIRIFRIKADWLALILSVVAEVIFFFLAYTFARFSEFGTPLNFIAWAILWFHALPSAYLPGELGESVLAIPAWLFQWWLIFFILIVFVRFVFRSHDPQTLRKIIIVLTIALITAIFWLVHFQFWQISNWKDEVSSLVGTQGYEDADKDLKAGKFKKLIIESECSEEKYTGTNSGPYEVWTDMYFPMLPWPYRYSEEERVKAYNTHMKYRYEWSLTHTNQAK